MTMSVCMSVCLSVATRWQTLLRCVTVTNQFTATVAMHD